ncbi:hypothetical protein EMIHUDRAFT_257487, partial [Emiliania huxleyi CCMP1516]|uniref:Uncharacterized protein n=2 Tax=Emiliania huxleyi TaxID=2903 RepID=A0A0D3IIZ4_EMIH1
MSAYTPPPSSLAGPALDQCAQLAWPEAAGAAVIILAFATALPPDWLLGPSAAKFDFPLVLLGLGQQLGGMGNAVREKFYAVARAAALLRRLAPRAAVIVVDAWDTMVVNGVTASTETLLRRVSRGDRQLLSGECNSWPRCYRPLLAADDAGRRCLGQPGALCFGNSGAYAASAAALVDALLPASVRELRGEGV